MSLLHRILPPWVTLFNGDGFFFFFFLRPGADVPRLSRFLLNSESVTFVTQSIKMISQGSQIAAYTLRDCHRKFHRGLCKCSKRGIKCQLSSWGSMGGGWGRGGRCKAPPPVQSPPFLTQVESRSAYSLPAGSHFGLIFLLTSPAFPPLESALIDLR